MDVVVLLVALRDIVCPPTTVETLCWGVQLVPGVETPTLSEGRMLPWCSWTAGVTDEGRCWEAEECCCCGADERGPCGGCGGICGCCGGTAGEGGGAWGPSCWKLNVWLDGTAISVGPDGVCICWRCMGPCDVNRRRTCKHAKNFQGYFIKYIQTYNLNSWNNVHLWRRCVSFVYLNQQSRAICKCSHKLVKQLIQRWMQRCTWMLYFPDVYYHYILWLPQWLSYSYTANIDLQTKR